MANIFDDFDLDIQKISGNDSSVNGVTVPVYTDECGTVEPWCIEIIDSYPDPCCSMWDGKRTVGYDCTVGAGCSYQICTNGIGNKNY